MGRFFLSSGATVSRMKQLPPRKAYPLCTLRMAHQRRFHYTAPSLPFQKIRHPEMKLKKHAARQQIPRSHRQNIDRPAKRLWNTSGASWRQRTLAVRPAQRLGIINACQSAAPPLNSCHGLLRRIYLMLHAAHFRHTLEIAASSSINPRPVRHLWPPRSLPRTRHGLSSHQRGKSIRNVTPRHLTHLPHTRERPVLRVRVLPHGLPLLIGMNFPRAKRRLPDRHPPGQCAAPPIAQPSCARSACCARCVNRPSSGGKNSLIRKVCFAPSPRHAIR